MGTLSQSRSLGLIRYSSETLAPSKANLGRAAQPTDCSDYVLASAQAIKALGLPQKSLLGALMRDGVQSDRLARNRHDVRQDQPLWTNTR